MSRVTINDVAKRAGVSHTTVSWVIHDDPRITLATKEKVRAAIEELKYIPNLSARSLISGKSGNIAVLATFFSTIFELEIMRGLEEGLDNVNNAPGIQLFSTRNSPERKESILKTILYGRRADAVICLSLKPGKEMAQEFIDAKVPVILVEEYAEGVHSIKTRNEEGARMATRHLVSGGRKKIALVSGPLSNDENKIVASAQERHKGYRDVLLEAGLEYQEDAVAQVSSYYMEEGYEAFTRILGAMPDCDGIFCSAGDLVASGILTAAKEHGKKIPGDIGIVSFDDSFIAPLVSPALTTMRQPLREMGRTALETALKALKGEPVENIEYTPELIIRESCL